MIVRSQRYVGLSGAADILAVSTTRVRQLIAEGRLPATKVSERNVIIAEEDALRLSDEVRATGRPRLYELLVDSGSSVAHIGHRGGVLVGFCGRRSGAPWIHRPGEGHDVSGLTLCPQCIAQAPRHVVRYWRGRGARVAEATGQGRF